MSLWDKRTSIGLGHVDQIVIKNMRSPLYQICYWFIIYLTTVGYPLASIPFHHEDDDNFPNER